MAKLYIVPTPIGNLGDITLRALDILKSVDIIAAEDTRHTRKLLSHFEISKPLLSYHEYSDESKALNIINSVQNGNNVAFVSDAGTPGISDPGRVLVSLAYKNNVEVVGLPGACAAVCAYSISGLQDKHFLFYGFLDDKAGKRKEQLEFLKSVGVPIVLYVSPHKVCRTTCDIRDICGVSTEILVFRELTKIHEEHIKGTPDEIITHFAENEPRGEFVFILNIQKEKPAFDDEYIKKEIKKLIDEGMSIKSASKYLSEKTGISKNLIYNIALKNI